MTKTIETMASTTEKTKINKIIEFAKSLNENEQNAFINVMIGFEMARNTMLLESNTTVIKH